MRVIGLISLLSIPLALAAQQPYGIPIGEIRIEGDSEALLAVVPLHPGDILTSDAVRASIQALYDRGRYGRIDVDAVEAPDGVRLTFLVQKPHFLATVRLRPQTLFERPISSYVDLPYGERFSRTTLDRIVAAVEEQLRAEGYFQARVVPAYEFDDRTRLATVTVSIDAGLPARIRSVRFDGGEETFSELELANFFDVDAESTFSSERLDAGAERIRSEFADLRFLNTRITNVPSYDSVENAVDVNVVIEPGPFVLVQVRGYELSDDAIAELIPVFEEGSVDPDLIEEGRVGILEYLRREGYFEASVRSDFFEAPLDNAFQINYTVDSGERYSVREVQIVGNAFFGDDLIYERIGISRNGLFTQGVFSPELLDQAADMIEAMYAAVGFAPVRVGAEYAIEQNAITVVLRVDEGRRLEIAGVSFRGNRAFSDTELEQLANIHSGQPYAPANVENSRRIITSNYHAQGYPDVRVESTVDTNPDGVGIGVTYNIEEGSSYRIGKIFVAGNTRTQEKIVHRNSQLEEGMAYDRESILQAQQRLYATGLFNRVDIVTLEEATPGPRDLLIQLEDAGPLLLTYGLGVQDREGVRGTLEVSHNNLFGLDRSLSFRIRGSKREQSFRTTFREPRLFNWELDGFASLFVERTSQRQFDANRIDFSFQSLKRFANQDNLLVAASFQAVNLRDIRVNQLAAKFPDEVGTIQIGKLGASYIRDSRNDPLNPSRGNYFTGTFQLANRVFGSEVNFTSLFTQGSIYRPAKQTVLAASVRFGWNQPYGKTQEVPITERYFAGGSTTLRAFGLDEAGPERGGNALAIVNAEYRFPIPLLISGLGGAAFYDTGTVFPGISDFNFGDFTHTAGFGLRYETPLGPIRVDLGFNLNRQPQESRNQLFFTLGHTF